METNQRDWKTQKKRRGGKWGWEKSEIKSKLMIMRWICAFGVLIFYSSHSVAESYKDWEFSIENGEATIIAPALQGRRAPLWTGQIPLGFLDDQLLIRSVGLSSQGKLDDTSAMLAAKLNIPHHVGA